MANLEFAEVLKSKARSDLQRGIKDLFEADSTRADSYSFNVSGLHFDLSKTHIDSELMSIYSDFAKHIGFAKKRHELFSGAKINYTEDRSVLHTLLRDPSNHGIDTLDPNSLEQAEFAHHQFRTQYQSIKSQLAERPAPVRDIIHVGIGGSSLGTQLVFESLKDLSEDINIHFIGNIDAHQLSAILQRCDISSTLVIGVSKTFSTAETLKNINSIGEWYAQHGGQDYLSSVYAVTANPENALEFGIPKENTVMFPQWVGGRYSVWSSVSLSAALVLGIGKFEELLAGAASVDQYFYSTKPEQNICFLTAMMDHYYSNGFGTGSRAVFAYDYRLRHLVDYLQQLETESNGKNIDTLGDPVTVKTSPVVWGGVGTDVQHSVFQLLHQGTAIIPAEFILVITPDHDLVDHHRELLANGIAQTAALLAGQDIQTVKQLHAAEGLSELAMQAKVFSGERPSTTIMMDRLTPNALGSLLAFYEHRTFCGGLLCNINSFDQMGVELGKRLAKTVEPLLTRSGKGKSASDGVEYDDDVSQLQEQLDDLDSSTQALIAIINSQH